MLQDEKKGAKVKETKKAKDQPILNPKEQEKADAEKKIAEHKENI